MAVHPPSTGTVPGMSDAGITPPADDQNPAAGHVPGQGQLFGPAGPAVPAPAAEEAAEKAAPAGTAACWHRRRADRPVLDVE
jgi:hypothetical protein